MEQFFKIDEQAKREELERVLSSKLFRRAEKQKKLLAYLVNQEIAGEKVSGDSILIDIYEVKTFEKDDDPSFVRELMRALRENLKQYYAGEGKANPLRIELFPGSYQPVFRPWPPAEAVKPVKPVPGRRFPKWLGLVAAGAVVAGAVWFIYDRPCHSQVVISDPPSGARVRHLHSITITRKLEQSFCRCRDYLVVEPTDLPQLWVQGQLPDGPQARLTATFGVADTPAGTRFTVFVLTTKSQFGLGPVSQMAIAGARVSPAIEVSLEKP